jgi:putative oxidoreductase
MKYLFLLGRVLFSLVFIVKAIQCFCPKLASQMADMGVPLAHIILPLWALLALIGGFSILVGYKAKIGAWLLIVFLVPVTFYMHAFWGEENASLIRMHALCFWKNISLIGALLMITFTGSGPLSLKKG